MKAYSVANEGKELIMSWFFMQNGNLAVSIGKPAANPKYWAEQDKTKQVIFTIPQESLSYWSTVTTGVHNIDRALYEEDAKLESTRRYLNFKSVNGDEVINGYTSKRLIITKTEITLTCDVYSTINNATYNKDQASALNDDHFIKTVEDLYTFKLNETKMKTIHIENGVEVDPGHLVLSVIKDIIKNSLILSDTSKQKTNNYSKNNYSNTGTNSNVNNGTTTRVQYARYTGPRTDNYNWYIDHTNNNEPFRWTKQNGVFVKIPMNGAQGNQNNTQQYNNNAQQYNQGGSYNNQQPIQNTTVASTGAAFSGV